MKPRELIRLLEQHGWREVRQKGSHRIFANADRPAERIVIPDHRGQDVKKGLCEAILKKAGIP